MNFCAPQLRPEISTNKPSADEHEVSNLVSENSICRSRGFKGEYFLKPPIDIILEFPVPIDISHVLLGAQLRNQRSVAFSLLTQSSTSNTRNEEEKTEQKKHETKKECWHYTKKECNFGDKCKDEHIEQCSRGRSSRNDDTGSKNPGKKNVLERKIHNSGINTTEDIRQAHGTGVYECGSLVPLQEYDDQNDEQDNGLSSDSDVFLCVSNFYTQGEENALLSNPLYRHWFDVPRPKAQGILSGLSSIYTNNMRHTSREALQCVKKLMIRIMRTQHAGPCVLSRVEVWGQPALSSSIRQRKDLLNKWKGYRRSLVNELLPPRLYNSHGDDEDSKESEAKPNAIQISAIGEDCEVPDDFLDPITCDVMTIPLLLPTGHTVDSRTLERYIANESLWGRPASDPFSGLPFKEGRGPVPNVGLKVRIDRYILLNGNHSDLQNIGRSLYSSTNSQDFTESASTSGNINNLPSEMEKNINSGERIGKRKKSQLESGEVSEIEEGNSKNSKRNITALSSYQTDKVDHNDKIDTLNQDKELIESDKLLQSSINSSSSWSTFNSSQLTDVNQKSNSEVKRYLHPINTDRISKKTTPIQDNNMPDPGRSRLQMLNQVASLARPSSSSKVSSLIRPTRSDRGQPILIKEKDSSSNTHNLNKNLLNKSKPSSLICGDIRKDKFNLDLVLSNKDSCLCGEKDNLYNLNCNHILCRICIIKNTNENKIKCPECDIESQKSEISKHHKKSVFI